MFCKNCGKQIDEGTKFCNNCGAPQEAAAQPAEQPVAQPVAQPAQAAQTAKPAAPKMNGTIKIVIIVAVALVCALIGRFVIAPSFSNSDGAEKSANKVFQSQNDSKENITPDFSESSTTNEASNSSSDIKTKVFEAKLDDTLSAQINLSYKGDTTTSIIGYMNIYDLSLDAYDQMKYDTDICKQAIEDYNVQGAAITETEGDNYYTVSFSFNNLDFEDREMAAEVAAAYTSTVYENGKISASAAEKTWLSNGYTLVEER